jgi:uncharacterized repeat protein (TIGR01451 family)
MAGTRVREVWSRCFSYYLLLGLFVLTLACHSLAAPSIANTSTGTVNWVGGTTNNLTFPHTASGTFRALLVGVSLQISNSTNATVGNITYGGTALSRVTFINQGTTRRVEIWRLTNPPIGTANVVLTLNNVGNNRNVGVVATAMTLVGVDQTTPLGTPATATGNSATASVTVAAATNDLLIDTVASPHGTTVTEGSGQTQIWSQDSGNSSTDVNGSGSSEPGAASVTMTEGLSAAALWAIAGVAVKGTTNIADLAVSATNFLPNPVDFGNDASATFTVTNNGPNAASGVSFSMPLPSNVTLSSANASSGSCSGTTTITCNLGGLANGASASVTLTVTLTGAGAFSVTGTATATEFDPPSDSAATATGTGVRTCATPGKDGAGGTLTGVVNSYFAGSVSVAAGSTSVTIGSGTGANVNIAAGDLLIIMQMQDASISSVNDERYGDGTGTAGGTTGNGSGSTALNSAGLYEYIVATSAIAFGSGGTLNFNGGGTGSGLINSYTSAAASGTKGASRFQIIRVPQYSSATFSSGLTASTWNGSTGGVLAVDIAGVLTLGGTVSVDGMGFRGGAGRVLTGGAGANTDYRTLATNAANGGKGEGVAGTPRYVYSGAAVVNTGVEGYPNGSMARGAPGNAGGGGTDGHITGNDENTGGGGGGNGGAGGKGGNSWNSNLFVGGWGGAAFSSAQSRIAMGGGGGAGSSNNGTSDPNTNTTGINSSGAAGGGIVIVRAEQITGTGSITANGASALNVANDGGGGGGAGGTIVVVSNFGDLSGLTVSANGGKGGNAWATQAGGTCPGGGACNWHGTGGGGAGGVVLLSSAAGAVSVTGGASGITTTDAVAYNATPGASGTSSTAATFSSFPGTDSGAECAPDMTITNVGSGPYVRGGSFTYTIGVSNLGNQTTSAVVTMTDTLPTGLVPTTASGTGWLCSVAGQTVACNRSDDLSGGSAYPSITINGSVGQTTLDTIVNTATVNGGGEFYLLNDSATDTTTASSIADVSVTSTDSPDPVNAGSNITYSQVVANAGPSDAGNASFSTTVPANTGFQSIAVPSGWSCVTPAIGSAGTITCSNPDLVAGASSVFAMITKVNVGVASGTLLTNITMAGSLAADPVTGNNAQASITTVGATAGADVTLTNSASPSAVVAGGNVVFSQVVKNQGSAAATTVTFSEPIPANTTFQSLSSPVGWSCSTPAVNGTGTISCSISSLAAGTSVNFSATVQVAGGTAAGTTITDTVTVGATNDSLATNNSATATAGVTSAGQSDLAISEVATASTVYAGNSIGFVQTVSNNGPAAATTVTVTETVPSGMTYQSMTVPPGWSCTAPSGGTFTCNTASLAVGAVATLQFDVLVPSSTANNTVVTNTTTVATSNGDPLASNNTASANTTALAAVDMAVTNTGTPNPVTAGGTITLTQVVTNNGPSDSGAATLVETIPANTTFGTISGAGWSCGTPSGGTVTCTIANMIPGASTTFTMTLTVNGGTAAGTLIANTASVSSASSEKIPANNAATFTDVVASGTQADVSVTASATPSPVIAGQNITYSGTVANNGPASASVLVYTVATPANTTFVSFSAPSGFSCTSLLPGSTGTITCNLATWATGSSAGFSYVVKVNSSAANGSTITTSSSISTTTSDPTASNNSASTSSPVITETDLAVTNSDSPDPVIANNNITYTQVVTNNGPSDAASLVLTETIPANTSFVSVAPPLGWSCTAPSGGTFTCSAATLAASATANFSVVLKVTAGTSTGTKITDTASVASNTLELSATNNSASTTTTVAVATDADLQVVNTAGASTVSAGNNVTFTTVVTNRGPALANNPSVTIPVPPNTTFQSLTATAGWTCIPALTVGSTGTVTCTNGFLASSSSASFAMVVNVNSGTAAGTVIGQTTSATATNNDPDSTNNSSTASSRVTSAINTDVAVAISGSPSSPKAGNAVTYTIGVTNNGPATATGVTVTAPIPSTEQFVSVSTNVGTCQFAGGVVTCSLGTMANGANATITLVVTATTVGSSTNSVSVTENENDTNSANNSASTGVVITAPTAVKLTTFAATLKDDSVVLEWRTKEEIRNLGFNLYREINGQYTKLNKSLIAGAALRMHSGMAQHTGSAYTWLDEHPVAGARYWLDDVSIAGVHTWNGPASGDVVQAVAGARVARSGTVAEMVRADGSNLSLAPVSANTSAFVAPGWLDYNSNTSRPTRGQGAVKIDSAYLAGRAAVKIGVTHEGWYRVSQAELVSAGYDVRADAKSLHLYAEGQEVPILVTNGDAGLTIEFYGTGIDTPYSDSRIYWLTTAPGLGRRVGAAQNAGDMPPASSYVATVQRRDRTVYLAGLTNNGDQDNFFGDVLAGTPVEERLTVDSIDRAAASTARLKVTLQGITGPALHKVLVQVNGVSVGELLFNDMLPGTFDQDVPLSMFQDGDNVITLTPEGGDDDVTAVDRVSVTYARGFAAQNDVLQFTVPGQSSVNLTGFTTPLRVMQMDSAQLFTLSSHQAPEGTYSATVVNADVSSHTYFAFAEAAVENASTITKNDPSQWSAKQNAADLLIVSHKNLIPSLAPLVSLRQSQGLTTQVVDVEDAYDEFNFGEHSPLAVKSLVTAAGNWKTAPKFLLLVGDASVDPRNFLGMGSYDMVPTKIVPTVELKTSDDGWFGERDDTGIPQVAIGRLPARTPAEADLMIARIVNYDQQSLTDWANQVLLVSDENLVGDFSAETTAVAALIPNTLTTTHVDASLDPVSARTQLLSSLNSGSLLVNYMGHGSVDVWSGTSLLNGTDVLGLANGSRTPFVVSMECLNGFFHDVYQTSLAESFLMAPNGGAVAVWASSGLTEPEPQFVMDKLLMQYLFANSSTTIGEATTMAKQGVDDIDVRRTWNLFGDPSMKLRTGGSATTWRSQRPSLSAVHPW